MAANVTEECISPEANRASDIYKGVAMTTGVITVLVVLSGVVMWTQERNSIWLQRRNPGLVWLLLLTVVSGLFAGSLFRWYLNDPESIFENCFFGNFFFFMIVPTITIPNAARIMSFHYRFKLHEKLSQLHKENNKPPGGAVAGVITGPPVNPVFFREKARNAGVISSRATSIDVATFSEVNALRHKAGSRYAFSFALGLLTFAVLCALSYCAVSCDVFAEDPECVFGSPQGVSLLLFLAPLVPSFVLYGYFRRLVRHTPDPFKIKAEVDIFIWLVSAGIFFSFLNTIDPGNLSKTGSKSDEDIDFKWIVFVDYCNLLNFMNAVHFQVIKAKRFNNSLKRVFPMSLQQILDHPEGCDLYEVFLQADFSVENLVLYKMIMKWKNGSNRRSSQSDPDAIAKSIFRQWIDKHARELDINLSGKTVESVTAAFQADGPYPPTIFDDVLEELFQLMEHDSFIRFVNTNEYKVFVGAQDPEKASQFSHDLEDDFEATFCDSLTQTLCKPLACFR